jgi:phage terminase large subunit-like protein
MTTTSVRCRPRWSSPRRESRPTWGPRIEAAGARLGKTLMPWQADLAAHATEVDPATGLLAYQEVRVTVPRQSGKTTLVLAKNIQRMIDAAHFGGRQRLVYTAQNRNKARDKFVDDYLAELQAAKAFRGKWKARLSNGSEAIRWHNGSLWGIESTTEKSGHGSTLDVGDIDEAFAHVDNRVEQSFRPPMITRPQPQLWIISTAGDDERSTYLKAKVTTGRQFAEAGIDRGVLYVEYCADPDADPGDPATWWSCMPALGHTQTQDRIQHEFDTMDLGDFARAYLNLWVPKTLGNQVIPRADWDACVDPTSQIAGGVVFAVDVAPTSAWASIAVCGARADGIPHVEVIDHRDGDGWVIERLAELHQRWGPDAVVVLDPTGPAGALLNDLGGANIETRVMTAREMTQACGGLKRAAADRTFRHLGQDVVTDALKGADKRQLLDAWAFRRTTSSADISPLIAVLEALWGYKAGLVADYDLLDSIAF